MLIALDDTLLHQTAESMAHARVSDHRFFDRTVFGMQSPSGDLALVGSFGVYKNMNVMDDGASGRDAGDLIELRRRKS